MKKKEMTVMQRIQLTVLVFAVVAVLLTACGSKENGGNGNGGGSQSGDLTLDDMVKKLYDKVDAPAYEVVPLDKTLFEGFAFIPYDDDYEAVAADALVNITAHSMVVIHTKDGNGKELAEKIVINADPNKWLCVGAEVVNVAYTDDYVVLVMSDKATADAIVENFKGLAKTLDSKDVNVLSSGNSRYEQ